MATDTTQGAYATPAFGPPSSVGLPSFSDLAKGAFSIPGILANFVGTNPTPATNATGPTASIPQESQQKPPSFLARYGRLLLVIGLLVLFGGAIVRFLKRK